MNIICKFDSLPTNKKEMVVDKLVNTILSSNDKEFCIKILERNLGTNGKHIINLIKDRLN